MPRRSMKKTNKKIAKLPKEGLSYKEIAELAGTDTTQVSRVKYMVKNGLLRKKRVKKVKIDDISAEAIKAEKFIIAKELLALASEMAKKNRARGNSSAESESRFIDGFKGARCVAHVSLFTKIKRFFGM